MHSQALLAPGGWAREKLTLDGMKKVLLNAKSYELSIIRQAGAMGSLLSSQLIEFYNAFADSCGPHLRHSLYIRSAGPLPVHSATKQAITPPFKHVTCNVYRTSILYTETTGGIEPCYCSLNIVRIIMRASNSVPASRLGHSKQTESESKSSHELA